MKDLFQNNVPPANDLSQLSDEELEARLLALEMAKIPNLGPWPYDKYGRNYAEAWTYGEDRRSIKVEYVIRWRN